MQPIKKININLKLNTRIQPKKSFIEKNYYKNLANVKQSHFRLKI